MDVACKHLADSNRLHHCLTLVEALLESVASKHPPAAFAILCWRRGFSLHSPKELSNRKKKKRAPLFEWARRGLWSYSSAWAGGHQVVRMGRQTRTASVLPRTPLKNTISQGSWGRFLSWANRPRALQFITVDRRDFLVAFLQQLASPEYLH